MFYSQRTIKLNVVESLKKQFDKAKTTQYIFKTIKIKMLINNIFFN
jgi:hypothetical protein